MINDKSPATDMVNMYGAVTIYQEDDDGNRTYICKDKQNHFTKHMIRAFCSYFCGNYVIKSAGYRCGALYLYHNTFLILLGSDTITITDNNLNDLITKININSTSSNISDLNIEDEENGNIFMNISSTWAKGTISGHVGEIGLYMSPFMNITSGWTYQPTYDYNMNAYSLPSYLCSRFASADENLVDFDIDTTKSLIILWKIGVSYA